MRKHEKTGARESRKNKSKPRECRRSRDRRWNQEKAGEGRRTQVKSRRKQEKTCRKPEKAGKSIEIK
jgi:hypothetical protein